jgi:hypothetical protein
VRIAITPTRPVTRTSAAMDRAVPPGSAVNRIQHSASPAAAVQENVKAQNPGEKWSRRQCSVSPQLPAKKNQLAHALFGQPDNPSAGPADHLEPGARADAALAVLR